MFHNEEQQGAESEQAQAQTETETEEEEEEEEELEEEEAEEEEEEEGEEAKAMAADMAKQALAATGGKSHLRATEWILNHHLQKQKQQQTQTQTRMRKKKRRRTLKKNQLSDHSSSSAPCGQSSLHSFPSLPDALTDVPTAPFVNAGGDAPFKSASVESSCESIGGGGGGTSSKSPPSLSPSLSLLPLETLIESPPIPFKKSSAKSSPHPIPELPPLPPPPDALRFEPSSKRQRQGEESSTLAPHLPVSINLLPPLMKMPSAPMNILPPSTQTLSPSKNPLPPPFQPLPPLNQPLTPPNQSLPPLNRDAPVAQTGLSLAERMMPNSIEEICGQEHLLGSSGVLRSLIISGNIPSMIFWGPSGSGKTSLAKSIAQMASFPFVNLSDKPRGGGGETGEIRKVLEDAKKKWVGGRVLLFAEALQKLKPSTQEAISLFLDANPPAVLIAGSAENPTWEVIPLLLSRCRIFPLNNLRAEHIRKLLENAVSNKEKGLLALLASESPPYLKGGGGVSIEEDALMAIAKFSDGNARIALNLLEAATSLAKKAASSFSGEVYPSVAAEKEKKPTTNTIMLQYRPNTTFNVLKHLKGNFQFSGEEEYTKPFKKFVGGKEIATNLYDNDSKLPIDSNKDKVEGVGIQGGGRDKDSEVKAKLVVTLSDVNKALYSSPSMPILVGEDSEGGGVLNATMFKCMEGGDANASVYWLVRILEKGESPCVVARCLIRFSSERIGLADPQAIVQAVACFRACRLLGMPCCTSSLAQCVAYLAMAPKSAAISEAVRAVQAVLRGGKNDPVPLPLWSSSPDPAKDLAAYLPPSLKGKSFLCWP